MKFPRLRARHGSALLSAAAAVTALMPGDVLALGAAISNLGEIDSEQRLWLAAFGGLSLGFAFGLFMFELRSRSLAVAVRRLIDLVVGMDGRYPENARRQSAARELARLSDELMFAAQRAARDRRDTDQRMASWEALFAAALDAMFGLDAAGRITYINPAAERLFRVKADEVVGKLLSDVMLPPTHRSPDNAAFASDMATGKAQGRLQELVAQRGDGRQFPVEVSIAAFGSGDHKGFVAVARDISQVRRSRSELNRLREQSAAAEAELREEIERLRCANEPAARPLPTRNAAVVEAELRAEIARLASEQDDAARPPSTRVHSAVAPAPQQPPLSVAAAHRARSDTGPAFTVEEVCGDGIRKLAARAERSGIGFRYEDSELQGLTLLGDAGRLRRVLIGLVDSVVRSTDTGEIVVHLAAVAGDGAHVGLVARVTSTAMSEAQAARMLRPFVNETVTRRAGGAYPGRAETHRAIEFLGTRVVHDTAPAAGATFSFELGFAADLSQVAIDLSALPSPAPRRRPALRGADNDPLRLQQEFAKSALRLRKHAEKANLIALWAEAHRLKDVWQRTGGRDDIGLVSALSHTARGGDATNAVLLARRLADALDATARVSHQPDALKA